PPGRASSLGSAPTPCAFSTSTDDAPWATPPPGCNGSSIGSPVGNRRSPTANPRSSSRRLSLRPAEGGPQSFHPLVGVAPLQVVVDEAHRLHEGVDRGRAHERPPPSLEVFA